MDARPTTGDVSSLWATLCDRLRDQVSEASWLASFHEIRPLTYDDGVLTLAVESWILKERFEQRHVDKVTGELRSLTGDHDAIVRVNVHDQVAALTDSTFPTTPPDVERPADPPTAPPTRRVAGLNERYTFDNFVTGPSNRFAQAAALAVAETPARSYNPLFIHGGAGLGKTHLLHGIAHYVAETDPEAVVRYVSTETFLNDYVDSLRTNSTSAFKRRYRDIDILLIDDIQFMAGKEGLQEEFFHTFNSLHGAGRQIVLSSDRPPRAIATLEERLRSRFEWGLITDIQPPDLETRLAILTRKAEVDRTPAPPDVLEFIASHVTSNIRELEGALIRVSAYASLNDQPLSLPIAREVLGDIVEQSSRPITVGSIIDVVSEYYDFSVEDLCGKQRHRALATARQIGMYLSRELTDLSYPQIGREFGNRDHTTVMHAVDKIAKQMAERQEIFDQVTDLTQRIRQR